MTDNSNKPKIRLNKETINKLREAAAILPPRQMLLDLLSSNNESPLYN